MQIGDEITIEASELIAGGDALTKIDGFPIFTQGIFPGDRARVRLTEVRKGFARAELLALEDPGPLRRAAPCPVAGECGGCNWTALRLDAQLEAKRHILSESLRRVGKFDPEGLPSIGIHASPLNYRVRSRLHRQNGQVGFFALRSNRVVPLPVQCEVVGPLTAQRFGKPYDEGERAERLDTATEAPAVSATHRGAVSPANGGPTGDRGAAADIDPEIWEIGGRLLTEGEFRISPAGHEFELSAGAFFQVNRHLLGTLLELVAAHASRCTIRRTAIDLYAGAGFFTAALAPLFERVIAVEGSGISHHYAKRNAAANVRAVRAPVESWPMKQADLIFLDPPRAGARPEVIDSIAQRARSMICYLSCDPVTFSRDAARLTASGWRLSTLDLLDLFPNTHHIETLASFERAEG